MAKPYDVVNEVQSTLSVQFVHGTDTSLTLADASDFPTGGGYIRIGTAGAAHWALYEYTGVSTNTLTGLTLCTLGNVESEAAYTFPVGTHVELTNAAEMIEDVRDEAIHKTTAAEIAALTEKTAPVAVDWLLAEDTEDSNAKKKIQIGNMPVADMELSSRTIYVDADSGSDVTGDGSSGSPFQTYSHALSTVKNVIANGVTTTIHLNAATATYTPADTGRVCIGTGKLVVEGDLSSLDSGTASGGTATTISDTTKAWTTDAYAGKLVKITMSGTDYYRLILSNTATELTVIGRLDVTPASGDAYVVYDWGTAIDGSTTWYFIQGAIEVNDVASTTIAATFIRPKGSATLTLQRCNFVHSGIATTLSFAGPATVTIDTVNFNGNSNNNRAIGFASYSGITCSIYRSWIRGYTSTNIFWPSGNGSSAKILAGTIIDGAGGTSTCVLVEQGCALTTWQSLVNGARDVITIKNAATYGLYVQYDGSAIYTGATYVTYSGNTTADRGADSTTYGFYTD